MKNHQLRFCAFILFALTLTTIAACESSAGEDQAREKIRLKKHQLGSTTPVHAFGNIYLAGQPSPDDLAIFRSKGIKTVITLRHTKELSWDEANAVKQNDMKFIQVPFLGADQLKPKTFDKLLEILRDKKQGPVVLHCGSSNRVGAIWYAYRILDGKLSHDEAKKEAQTVGLRTPAYLDMAQKYVAAKQKEQATVENP